MATSGIQVQSFINLGAMNADPAVPAWTLLPCVRAEGLDMSPAEIEANCRNGGGFEFAVTGLLSGAVSMTYLFDLADAAFNRIKSDMLLGNKSQYAFMFNGFTTGHEGFVSPMNVVNFNITRDYDSVVEVEIGFKPFFVAGIPPIWWTVP